MCIWLYMYVYKDASAVVAVVAAAAVWRSYWVFITGGCSGRGVQWMGVALYNQTTT